MKRNKFTVKKKHTATSQKNVVLNELKRNYFKIGHPLAFAGPATLYRHYRHKLTLKEIKEFLKGVDSYTVFRQAKKNKQFNPVYILAPRHHVEIDLITYDRHKGKPFYILACIDGFTKRAFAAYCPKKDKTTVLGVFKTLFETEIKRASKLISDLGKEFLNNLFLGYCEENEIRLICPRTNGHAPFIERFISTFRSLVAKWKHHNQSEDFVPALQQILNTYNK